MRTRCSIVEDKWGFHAWVRVHGLEEETRFWVRSEAGHSFVKTQTWVCKVIEESWKEWIFASFQCQFFKRDWQRVKTLRLLQIIEWQDVKESVGVSRESLHA